MRGCWLSVASGLSTLSGGGYGEDMLEEIESMSRLVEFGDKDGGQALVLQ